MENETYQSSKLKCHTLLTLQHRLYNPEYDIDDKGNPNYKFIDIVSSIIEDLKSRKPKNNF